MRGTGAHVAMLAVVRWHGSTCESVVESDFRVEFQTRGSGESTGMSRQFCVSKRVKIKLAPEAAVGSRREAWGQTNHQTEVWQ